MKNPESWTPSKYVYRRGKLIASRNPEEVGVASRLMADRLAALYQENLKHYAKGRLLDLGCGKAPLYHAYRDLVTEGVCVDWANSRHPNPHLDAECDLNRDLPFADGEFDTILLSDVLEHLPRPRHLWREMRRVLSPGGILFLNVPFYYRIHEQPHDYYRYTEFALRRFAEETGFALRVFTPLGGSPEVFADLLGKHLVRIPLIGPVLTGIVQSLTAGFVRTGPGRRLSRSSAEVFPSGYFLVAEKTAGGKIPHEVQPGLDGCAPLDETAA